jgi:hypothetical protein
MCIFASAASRIIDAGLATHMPIDWAAAISHTCLTIFLSSVAVLEVTVIPCCHCPSVTARCHLIYLRAPPRMTAQ